jgi:hypothetical protein
MHKQTLKTAMHSLTHWFLCRERGSLIIKYRTTQSGQELRLRPSQQFYVCVKCNRYLGPVLFYDPAESLKNLTPRSKGRKILYSSLLKTK